MAFVYPVLTCSFVMGRLISVNFLSAYNFFIFFSGREAFEAEAFRSRGTLSSYQIARTTFDVLRSSVSFCQSSFQGHQSATVY